MIIRTIKKLREEKARLESDIRKLTIQKRLLKSNCCDFCMNELLAGRITSNEVRDCKYSIDLPFFKLKICEAHLKELYKATRNVLKGA